MCRLRASSTARTTARLRFAAGQSRADHDPLRAGADHDDLGDCHRPRAEDGKVDGGDSDGRGLTQSLAEGLNRGLGEQAVAGGVGGGALHFADQECHLATRA